IYRWAPFPVHNGISKASLPCNPDLSLRRFRFGLFPFRSPLLREWSPLARSFFSVPLATGMFYFARFAPCIAAGSLRVAQWGFPIRKFPDHRLLRTSPRRIAATLRPSSPFDV